MLGKQEEVDRFYVEFGRRLREARTSSGQSQEVLGVQVGLNRTSISNVESGRQRLLLHQLPLLAKALQRPISDLLPSVETPDVLSTVPEDARAWVEQVLGDDRIGD